jgi:hypothetical protein
MNKRKAPLVSLAMLVAGIGAGNMTAQPETIQLPAPAAIVLPAPEPVEVPVRFEELHHKADRSLQTALKLPYSKNSDIVALVANKDELIDKMRVLAGQVAKDNEVLTAELLKTKAALSQASAQVSAAADYRQALQGGSK